MSRRSSSRKEDLVLKVKKKEVLEINSDDDDDDDDKTKDDPEVVSLSDASDDEVIAPKKQRGSTFNKAAFSMPDDISKLMNRVLCTACGKQINPMNPGAVRKHPWLKVVTCKKCYKFLKSGPFTRDEDGTDEQCRWCGDGGRLYGCDYCNNCFCRSCIKRNIGRSEAAEMESEDATKQKWKCYMCKPKKIRTLQENCTKILDYIKSEEEKDKQKEERAKQREKEKAQAKKDKANSKEDDKKDRRNSLPIPTKLKTESNDTGSREKTPNKTSFPAPKPKNSIVIEDSPEKPINKMATAKSHLPVYQSRPGDGVTQVQKVGNGVTQVIVGPKAKQPVSMPYKDGLKLNNAPTMNRTASLHSLLAPKPIQPMPLNRPNLLGALTNQFTSAPTNVVMMDKKAPSLVAKTNDIRALKEQIVPFNVETVTEKLTTVAQALSLTLNHVKTDLAIAKLSSSNLFNSRSSAAYSVKTGLDVFFNNVRDIFNVQITTASPSSEEPITLDDDEKPVIGLPNGTDSGVNEDSAKESVKKEVKEEIKTEIKEEIKTEVKSETNGPIEESKEDTKTEKNDTEEKMETDGVDPQDNKSSDKVLNGDDKDDSENDKMETSDTDKKNDQDNESEGDTKNKKKSGSSSKKLDKSSSSSEPDKSENTAAELDILKELADEINEANERDESAEEEEEAEPRRSSRRKKSHQDSQDDDDEADKSSETEQTSRRSSSRKKQPSKESSDEKVDKKNQKSSRKTQEKEKDKGGDSDENSEPEQEQRRTTRKKPDEKDKDSKESKDTKDFPDKKSKDKTKNDTKNNKSSSEAKSDADEPDVNDNDDNEEISSDSDSDESTAEFGKRRTRRKQKEKNEDKSKSESKSKGAKSDKTKGKEKSEKTDKKESRPTRSKKSSDDKEEENHSDSSNFDADLEKDIKSLSKDTKLTRSSRRTGKEESDSTEKEDNAKDDKKTSKKGKVDKSKKEDSVEESDNSQDKSDEEVEAEDPPQDTKDKKTTKGKGGKSKSKKEESDNDDEDADNDGGDESKDEEEENEDVDEDDLSPAQLRKLRAAQKKDEESDYEDMVASDNSDSEDPEVSFPKLSTPKKGQNKKGKGKLEITIESDDSDFVTPKKNNKRKLKSDLLDAKVSDSDSDVGAKKKKKGRGKKRKKEEEEEDEEPDPEDEVYSDDEKKKKGKGKRKRIRKVASSSDEEKEKGEEGGDEDDENDLEDTPGGAHKRRKIRKVMANKKLADSTKEARKIEEERRKRIEERQKEFNAYVEVEGGEEEEEVPEGTEREVKEGDDSISKILGTAKKVPVTTKCVLDMEKDTKKVLVEIDRTLVRKLKPHQVEAVRFMYNCCVESVERMKKEEGAGCILAHCMGLGKTLSVISFLHTMLKHTKLTKTTKCLVVCPLNTVLNWVNEFEIWLEDVDYEIEIYEMSKVKQNYERAQMLREWHEGGAGVMILGYDMYRNLVNGSHCKNKKQKTTFYETLADPGPDIVVCDEGHILKNDQTSLSKAMMKIKSKRRVVLTGTPLQNNLGEYHCMVSFVKPNLLGTRKEFSNRFVNPITNGQCSDSTGSDVKLMKRRAHILHEMLAGCVQRRDYSALTKFLPPKFEYVVSVRMSPLQCTLYENYLKEAGIIQDQEVKNKGGRLFRDYQALMRIWTHPWVLKLDEIRQENKRTYDSEDSFIDDETDEEAEDSFLSGSTTSESDADFNPKSKKKKKSKGKKGKQKKGSDSEDSDSDAKKSGDENEVIKKWSSKRRGNEEGAGSSWMQDMGYSTGPKEVSDEWWAQYVKEEDEFKIELSGKLSLMFEILRMCEDIGDKVLIFSQSLLSLDIIEDFLHYVDESNNKEENEDGENKDNKDKKDGEKSEGTSGSSKDDKKEKTEEEKKKEEKKKEEDKKREKYAQYGKSWTVGADYFRMDGSTNSQQRKAAQDSFNDPENYRARLFLISTKAGSLGINLVAANRVIIFDASWNPSHDIQSIFRVYRFGQIKPVYVYRFLAQGTMEEKIYERQVTKQSLSQRVVDEHQIERHFSANDLQELYKFQPDRLDDPDKKDRPLPMLPKDHMLAELMSTQKDWIVTFHEHDSLLENIVEQELSEEEKKAAWEDYENEKKGLNNSYQMYGNMMSAQQRMNSALEFQNLVLQGQANLGQEAVLQIVQDLKARFPTLPPEVFSQRVQAVLRQVLTQRIMQQSDFQRRQLDQQKMAELNRLNQLKQQIQQQQAMLNSQQRSMGVGGGNYYNSLYGVQALPSSGFSNNLMARAMGYQNPQAAHSSPSLSTQAQQNLDSKGDKR